MLAPSTTGYVSAELGGALVLPHGIDRVCPEIAHRVVSVFVIVLLLVYHQKINTYCK